MIIKHSALMAAKVLHSPATGESYKIVRAPDGTRVVIALER